MFCETTFHNFNKHYKQTLKNYKPVSLLPINAKVLERLIYNDLIEYKIDNNLLIFETQSRFKTLDPCINQPLLITHDIYKFFDEAFEVKQTFF